MNHWIRTMLCCAIAMTVGSGCARGGADAAAHPSDTTAAAVRLPTAVSVATTEAPKIPYREFRLPRGHRVMDATDRLATVKVPTTVDYPERRIGLLDLRTGAEHLVIKTPVMSAQRFWMGSAHLSNSWIAWEEVSANESNEMMKAQWRLYAARITGGGTGIGKPVLVDQGHTSWRQRPMYAVDGDTVYWTRIEYPGGMQEYVERHGALLSRDMKTGAERTVFDSPATIASFKLGGAGAVLALTGSSVVDTWTAQIAVVGSSSESAVTSVTVDARAGFSHFADASDGYVTWASFANKGDAWPDAFIRSPDGRVDMCAAGGLDACFAGDLMFFESNQDVRTSSDTVNEKTIWGYDPARRTRFVLLKTTSKDNTEGWWQPVTTPKRQDTLVLWNDIGMWSDPLRDLLLVRVYDVKGARLP